MAYIKLKAERLFDGKHLHHNKVLITSPDGRIEAVLDADHAGVDPADTQLVDGWLCPGFVNAHCHTELSHLQGCIAQGEGMVPFLQNVMQRRAAPLDLVVTRQREAIQQMHRQGIAAVGDVCNTAHGFATKADSPVYFHHFLELSGFVTHTASARFEAGRQLQSQLIAQFDEAVTLAPHAPYSTSPALLSLIAQHGNNVCTIHHQESAAELDFMAHKTGPLLQLFDHLGIDLSFFEPTGATVLQGLLPFVGACQKLLLVHNCMVSEADAALLATVSKSLAPQHRQLFWCVCPSANGYIGNPLPNFSLLHSTGLPMCVGTDSLASNTNLCVLSELKLIQAHAPHFGSAELLQWGTQNGAVALGIGQKFGCFEPGARPGVLILSNIGEANLRESTVQRLM
jgi:aminodeoxyfutalosine deaminase